MVVIIGGMCVVVNVRRYMVVIIGRCEAVIIDKRCMVV